MLAPLFLTGALLFIGYTWYSLHTILCKVRPLGIPYFVIPFYHSPLPRLFLFPLVKLLVKVFGLTHPWCHLMTLDWQVHQRYEIYRHIGSDIFFTVTPWKVILHVADPDMAIEVLAGKGENGELYPKIELEESLTQIEQMIQYYDKSEVIDTSHRDFRRATLGIMTRAGFSRVMR